MIGLATTEHGTNGEKESHCPTAASNQANVIFPSVCDGKFDIIEKLPVLPIESALPDNKGQRDRDRQTIITAHKCAH